MILALVACSDYAITDVSEDAPADDGWPDGPDPWSDLDVGALPETWFVVAWSPYGPYTRYDAQAWSSWSGTLYSLFDVEGQEVLRFETPENVAVSGMTLEPAGPGAFQATVQAWTVEEDGSIGAMTWEIWRGDAAAQTFEPIVRWDTEQGDVTVVATGDRIDIDPAALLSATTFGSDPDRVWTWATQTAWCDRPLGPFRGWNVAHAAPGSVRQPEALVGATRAAVGGYVGLLEGGTSSDGHDRGLVGVYEGLCETNYDPSLTLSAFDLNDGPLWAYEIGLATSPGLGDVRFSAEQADANWVAMDETGAYRYFHADANGLVSGLLGTDHVAWRTGPTLGPATFAAIGAAPDWTGDALVFFHRGKPVWTIDDFKFGLGTQPMWIQDVVVLPQPANP